MLMLQHGRLTPAGLSTATGINRPTTYAVAESLSKKGLILEDIGSSQKSYVVRKPDYLMEIIEKEEHTLQKKRSAAAKAITELDKIAVAREFSIPKVTFIPQEDILRFLKSESAKWNDSLAQYDTTWWGFQDKDFVAHYDKWIDWYWEKSAPNNMKLKLLSNESAEKLKKKQFPNRQIRFFESGANVTEDFSATTWVNGDYIISIITNQNPHYLVEIHDKQLAHNYRLLFKSLW